jgi:hypothetical protein
MSDNFNINDLDTNINNYTNESLYNLLGFTSAMIPNNSEIEKKINDLMNNNNIKNNKKIQSFFTEVKNKLLNSNINNANNYGSNSVINRKLADIQNSKNLALNQDTLNPNYMQTTLRTLTIDSFDRENTTPYSCNTNSATCSTKFLCNLSESLKNVTKLKLDSVHIPKTWYTFDDSYANTAFQIDLSSGDPISIHIQEGNYTPGSLVNEINDIILTFSSDLSGLIVTLDNSNVIHPKIKFINNTGQDMSLNFYQDINFLIYDISCGTTPGTSGKVTIKKYTDNLGYYLGFRITDEKVKDLKYDLLDGGIIIGDVPIDVRGSKYFIIQVDDFNYNYTSNAAITIENKSTQLDVPNYYNQNDKIIYDISCSEDFPDLKFPTFPRQLTQSQIYAFNQIVANNKLSKNKTNSKSNSNQLAIIYLEDMNNLNKLSITYTNLAIETKNERKYFGPVCIEKLHISLYNDKGDIVNLHGHDWSITLIAENLYKY